MSDLKNLYDAYTSAVNVMYEQPEADFGRNQIYADTCWSMLSQEYQDTLDENEQKEFAQHEMIEQLEQIENALKNFS